MLLSASPYCPGIGRISEDRINSRVRRRPLSGKKREYVLFGLLIAEFGEHRDRSTASISARMGRRIFGSMNSSMTIYGNGELPQRRSIELMPDRRTNSIFSAQ